MIIIIFKIILNKLIIFVICYLNLIYYLIKIHIKIKNFHINLL